MTQESRIDRLEGMMERAFADMEVMRQDTRKMRADMLEMQTKTRSEMRDMETRLRSDMQNMQGRIDSLRSESDYKFRTLLLVMFGLWGITVVSIIGLLLTIVLQAD